MIYVTGGIKGGTGKSTIAVNLVIQLCNDGFDVLLVDADDQETSTDFTYMRTETLKDKDIGYTAIKLTGRAVRDQVLKQEPKYDHIVIDTGGRDTASQRAALSVADLFLVPFVPRSFDVWTLERVSALVDEMRTINPDVKAMMFLNRADSRGKDNQEAQDYLTEDCEALEFLNAPLCSRKAFANAAASGLGISEFKPQDEKAIAEFMQLYRYCISQHSTVKQ